MHKPELRSKVHAECVKAGDAEALNLCECKVCYDMPVRTVFINCGHIDPALSRLSRRSLHLEARCASPCVYDLGLAGLESTRRHGTPTHWRIYIVFFSGGGINLVCCTRCALQLVQKELPCPICREPVGEAGVIRLHDV